MYPHVGPYTPYFGFGYGGIGRVPIGWPPMFNPLTNPIAPLQPILEIAQTRVVIDHKEPLNEGKESFERKHNPKMLQIIPTKKMYHEQKGKPSLIGNANGMPIEGQVVLFSKGGGGPSGGGGGLLRGSGNKPPKLYVVGPT
jgi:hypothetical protein